MQKKIISAGILGGITLALWTFVVNGLLGFNVRVNMKTIPDQPAVYETLKTHVVEPGRYVINPELTSENRFPVGEPVFSVLYGGMGHESAKNGFHRIDRHQYGINGPPFNCFGQDIRVMVTGDPDMSHQPHLFCFEEGFQCTAFAGYQIQIPFIAYIMNLP